MFVIAGQFGNTYALPVGIEAGTFTPDAPEFALRSYLAVANVPIHLNRLGVADNTSFRIPARQTTKIVLRGNDVLSYVKGAGDSENFIRVTDVAEATPTLWLTETD